MPPDSTFACNLLPAKELLRFVPSMMVAKTMNIIYMQQIRIWLFKIFKSAYLCSCIVNIKRNTAVKCSSTVIVHQGNEKCLAVNRLWWMMKEIEASVLEMNKGVKLFF